MRRTSTQRNSCQVAQMVLKISGSNVERVEQLIKMVAGNERLLEERWQTRDCALRSYGSKF